MRVFTTQDGTHLPVREPGDVPVRDPHEGIDYACSCHKRMGNDFWFLPKGECLRQDRTCDGDDR